MSNDRKPDDLHPVRMIDVGEKPVTERGATATARVAAPAKVIDAIFGGAMPKGDVIGTAKVAGIMAAKRTPDLLPLCHPLPIDAVEVSIARDGPAGLVISVTVRARARTGVEMEAMTAAAAAALCVYDMSKAMHKGIEIGPVRLESKSGGKSGDYRRSAGDAE